MPSSGPVIQLAAIGKQNAHINPRPTETRFIEDYTQYSPFALDFDEASFTGGTVGFSETVNAEVPRYGDLVYDACLEMTFPGISAPAVVKDGNGVTVLTPTGAYWVNGVALTAAPEVTLNVGGAPTNPLVNDYMFALFELLTSAGRKEREMIGRFDFSNGVETLMMEYSAAARKCYLPLPFYFNRYWQDMGNAIPLVSLRRHDVTLKVKFGTIAECAAVVYRATDNDWGDFWELSTHADSAVPLNTAKSATLANADLSARLLIHFAYLDDEERLAYQQPNNTINYLMIGNQIQQESVTTAGTAKASVKIFFNHPCRALYLMYRPGNYLTAAGRRRYSVGHKDRWDLSLKKTDATASLYGDAVDPLSTVSFTLNSHDRLPKATPAEYLRMWVPYRTCKNLPSTPMYVIALAGDLTTSQPDATLNFSKVDHANLELTYAADIAVGDWQIINEHYNVFAVKDGLGGMRYAD